MNKKEKQNSESAKDSHVFNKDTINAIKEVENLKKDLNKTTYDSFDELLKDATN